MLNYDITILSIMIVVMNNQNAVLRKVYIQLVVRRAQRLCAPEGGNGILDGFGGRAAMGKINHTCSIKK